MRPQRRPVLPTCALSRGFPECALPMAALPAVHPQMTKYRDKHEPGGHRGEGAADGAFLRAEILRGSGSGTYRAP